MPAGRPPAWRLPGAPHAVFVDPRRIDAHGHVQKLSPILRGEFAWLAPGSELLCILTGEPGRVRLAPPEEMATVVTRIKERAAALEAGEDSAEDVLHDLQDRYQRAAVEAEPEGRLILPLGVTSYLDALTGGTLFIAGYLKRVEIWSTAYREHRLAQSGEHLTGLP